VEGLRDALGRHDVSTIYDAAQCEYVWESIQKTTSGLAVFTVPGTPIKCGGAPQKIMYLAEDFWREHHRRSSDAGVQVLFATALTTMCPVPYFSEALDHLRQEKGIEVSWQTELVQVRGDQHEAVFHTPAGERVIQYAMLHVVPPMRPHQWLATSPLADAAGWVDVHPETLQHRTYPNVFALGDCANLPTSKTAAAVSVQAPVCTHNLKQLLAGRPLTAKYNGYTSCPLITGRRSLMLAEFLYGGRPAASFAGDPREPRYSFMLLARYLFPFVYWHFMLRGLWYGPQHLVKPAF
jgi:sulfide:quinone oxidoreductase